MFDRQRFILTQEPAKPGDTVATNDVVRIDPLSGLRGTLIAGSCLVAAAISMGFDAPWPVWAGLFVIAFFLALRKG